MTLDDEGCSRSCTDFENPLTTYGKIICANIDQMWNAVTWPVLARSILVDLDPS